MQVRLPQKTMFSENRQLVLGVANSVAKRLLDREESLYARLSTFFVIDSVNAAVLNGNQCLGSVPRGICSAASAGHATKPGFAELRFEATVRVERLQSQYHNISQFPL